MSSLTRFLRGTRAPALLALAVIAGPRLRAAGDAPIKMDKVTVSATGLDVSSDPTVDYVIPRLHVVFEYLGHDVPPAAILDARTTDDLKKWRPTYHSLDEFVAGVKHSDWTLIRARDLPNFYVAVFATAHGNVAGLYYAKTAAGYRQEQSGQLQLYLSDEQYQPVVSSDEIFSVEQRFGYAVRSFGSGPTDLAPDNTSGGFGDNAVAEGAAATMEASTKRGWVIVHQGQLFVVPPKLTHFLFVFASKLDSADRVVLAFADRKP